MTPSTRGPLGRMPTRWAPRAPRWRRANRARPPAPGCGERHGQGRDILKDAQEAFKLAADAEATTARALATCARRLGEQWPADIRKQREAENGRAHHQPHAAFMRQS